MASKDKMKVLIHKLFRTYLEVRRKYRHRENQYTASASGTAFAEYNNINTKAAKFTRRWPCGPMDKASDYESGDSRFESWQGRFLFLIFFFLFFLID